MSAPQRWRDAPPGAPEAARGAALLEGAGDPAPTPGAQARVWGRLQAPPPAKPARWAPALALGAAAAAAALWWGVAPGPSAPVSPPAQVVARSALPPEPEPMELAVIRGPARLELEGLGVVELPVEAAIETPAPGSGEVVVLMGPVRATARSPGLRLVAGRYAVTLAEGAEVSVSTGPFEATLTRGQARLQGPDGERSLGPPDMPPQAGPLGTSLAAEPPAQPSLGHPDRPLGTALAAEPPARRAPPARGLAEAAPGPGGPRLERPEAPPEALDALYRRAVAEREPDAAVALFDRVAAAPGPFAEIAGHQAVRRRMAQGQLQDALRRLDALEARFPDGAHLPELWLSRVECRVALGAPGAARPDLDAYLARWPGTPRAGDLFFLRAELHRAAGGLLDAAADYARVSGGAHAEEAAYLGAWCLAEARAPGARAAALAYLARYPAGRFAEEARALMQKD